MTTEQLIQLGVAALTVVFSALAIRNVIRTRRALRQAEQTWERAAETWRKAADDWRKVAEIHARRSEEQR
jgi:hypothetical protein